MVLELCAAKLIKMNPDSSEDDFLILTLYEAPAQYDDAPHAHFR